MHIMFPWYERSKRVQHAYFHVRSPTESFLVAERKKRRSKEKRKKNKNLHNCHFCADEIPLSTPKTNKK